MRNRREISGSFLRRSNSARARSVWLQPSIYQKSETLNQILPRSMVFRVLKMRATHLNGNQANTENKWKNNSMVPPPIFASVNSFATNWMIQVAKDRWFFPQISWVETMALTYLELAHSRLVLPTRPAKQTLRGRKKTSPKFNMCTNDIGRSLMNFRIQVY